VRRRLGQAFPDGAVLFVDGDVGGARDEALGEDQEAGSGGVFGGGKEDTVKTSGDEGSVAKRPGGWPDAAVESGVTFPWGLDFRF